jgi:uncharacterized protein YkwD
MVLKKKRLMGMLVVLGVVLAGCGGGSSSDTSSTNSNDQGSTQNQTQEPTPADTTPPAQTDPNQQPSAQITATKTATSGETVTLDGTASNDPDGDTLSFLWSQTQGAAISLGDLSNPSLSFIAPSVAQTTKYSFQLQVSDGELTDSVSVTITVSPMADTTPPTIVSMTPEADATDVSTTAGITVTFDEALDASLINDQTLQLSVNSTPVPGSVAYDAQNNTITLSPDTALATQTTYSVTLADNLRDLAGNPAAGVSWSFTTGSQYNLGQTPQSTIDLCMSTSDKLMLTLVNNARAVARSCGTTDFAATAPLAWHCSLEQSAQSHSTSMADNDYFSHTGIDNSSPGDRITATGYVWRTYGENIAAGYNSEEAVMDAWLASEGHCGNIMNPAFTEMGEASAENASSQYITYWTQDFADQF